MKVTDKNITHKGSTPAKKHVLTRRQFVKRSAAVAAFTIVDRYVLGGTSTPPSEKLNIGIIGAGNQGTSDMKMLMANDNVKIVAVCDVSEVNDYSRFGMKNKSGRGPVKKIVEDFYAEKSPTKTYKGCDTYIDFRQLLEREDIDAVVVATPDHTHAVITMEAMKKGKHVYCEKPLTHSVAEARKITAAARKYNVVTQMGTQLHATEPLKLLVEMVKSGVIGDVSEVHVWIGRTWGGKERPKEGMAIPKGMNWDLWLGPAPYRPFHTEYHPWTWRNWRDFGTGVIGDFGCHIIDPVFWSLNLGNKFSVEAVNSSYNDESYPLTSTVKYEFPARGKLGRLKLIWHDNGLKPFRPTELEEGRDLPKNGSLFIGDKGKLLVPYTAAPRLIPESKMKDFKPPQPFLPRGLNHYQDWVRGCLGGPKPLSNFEYAGPLTEIALLGNVAVFTGKKIKWNGSQMKVTNAPDANKFLSREYREGWTL